MQSVAQSSQTPFCSKQLPLPKTLEPGGIWVPHNPSLLVQNPFEWSFSNLANVGPGVCSAERGDTKQECSLAPPSNATQHGGTSVYIDLSRTAHSNSITLQHCELLVPDQDTCCILTLDRTRLLRQLSHRHADRLTQRFLPLRLDVNFCDGESQWRMSSLHKLQ